MSKKMMSPNTRLDAYPVSGLVPTFDGDGKVVLTAAQLNAGLNISAAVQTGYTLGATDSGTDTSKTVADEGNVETRTIKNYEGTLTAFRDPLDVAPTVFTDFYNLFKVSHAEHWIGTRHGKKFNAPYAAGDIVSIYRFKNDPMREMEADDNGPMTVEVEFLPQGEFFQNVTLA